MPSKRPPLQRLVPPEAFVAKGGGALPQVSFAKFGALPKAFGAKIGAVPKPFLANVGALRKALLPKCDALPQPSLHAFLEKCGALLVPPEAVVVALP